MRYDWNSIQTFYDAGNTIEEVVRNFGCARATIYRAVKDGYFTTTRGESGAKCANCSLPLIGRQSKFCSGKCKKQLFDANRPDTRQETKQKLVSAFGGACGQCGLVDHPCVYDFHHIDGDKEFGIAQKTQFPYETVLAEAKKCVMLCSPCHRKHHAGVLVLKTDIVRITGA